MAHTYAHLYRIPLTGLRLFTVYGPWGRPDMAPFLFVDAVLHNRPIKVFNNGDMLRDFTYIDDIAECVVRALDTVPRSNTAWDAEQAMPDSSSAPYRIYNAGNSSPVRLMDFIQTIEKETGKEAEKVYLPMQAGDVYRTYADTSGIQRDLGCKPHTTIQDGIRKTVNWFKDYYHIGQDA
jgi:UDP-glucuronate 4-epimerase